MSEVKVEDILEPTQPDKEAPQETKQESKKNEPKKEEKKPEKKPEEKKEQPKKAEPKKEEKKPEKAVITYPVKVKVDNEVTIFANRQFTKMAGKANVFTVLGIQKNVGTVCFGNKFIGCVPCNEEVLKKWMDS